MALVINIKTLFPNSKSLSFNTPGKFISFYFFAEKDLGSLQHRGDEALPFRVAGANSNLKHSMMY